MRTRREIAASRALAQTVAQTSVMAASNATVVMVQIDEAVSGDLIERSPTLAAKLREIDERIDGLEPPATP